MTHRSAGATRWQVRHAPPLRQPGHVSRPRLSGLIDERLRDHNALLVIAPSGFGKTSAVSEWAAHHPGRVAWLALGPFEPDATRVGLEVLRALRDLALASQLSELAPLLEVAPTEDSFETFEQLMDALATCEQPIYLVIDDAHRAQGLLRKGLLGALVHAKNSPLQVVLVGTSALELELNQLTLSSGTLLAVGAQELAFTLDEVAVMHEQHALSVSPATLLEESRGWPLALRIIQIAGTRPASNSNSVDSLMSAYINDHLLPSLPTEIANFALATSVCGEMSEDLADAVSGRGGSAELLSRCTELGLFIDKYETPKGNFYRWHAVFARHCQRILDANFPGARYASNMRAAQHIAPQSPFLALTYWLQAGETELAVEHLLAHWPEFVVGPDVRELNRWCIALPTPFDDDPRILLVRACAQEVIGEPEVAQLLLTRAEAEAFRLPDRTAFDEIHAQALLLLADGHEAVAVSATRVRRQLASGRKASARTRAALTFLLGLAGLRLRMRPDDTIQFLSAAASEADATGDRSLARRARGHLAYALTWVGQLSRARHVLAQRIELGDYPHWAAYAGAASAAAASSGSIAYWTNDLEGATQEFTRAMAGENAQVPFAGVARMMLAFSASAARDPQACKIAARELQAIPTENVRGVPWPVYRHAALAALHEAAGHRGSALKIAERYADETSQPLVNALLSAIALRAGRLPLAAQLLAGHEQYHSLSYFRVTKQATEALMLWNQDSRSNAHELIEHTMDLAVIEDIRRPFAGSSIAMRSFFTEHLAWGTRHEQFLSECLTQPRVAGPLSLLSERENTVFAQLRTNRTMQEIADELGVSINTVKTHQRSIYRKLDVSTRRDAVRLFT